MTEPTMRERIARVIKTAGLTQPHTGQQGCGEIGSPERRAMELFMLSPEACGLAADLVLAEMTTPTEAMLEIGAGEFDRRNFDDPFTSSRDMAAEFWEAVMAKARQS